VTGRAAGAVTVVPCVVFLVVAYAVPVGLVFHLGLTLDGSPSLAHLSRALNDATHLRVLWATLKWSALVTALCLVLGYPVAYLLTEAGPRVFTLALACVVLPFSMSLLVRTYAWMILLGHSGPFNALLTTLGLVTKPLPLLNNLFAVVLGMVQVLLPFMILSLYSAMKTIDPAYVRAASSLGARPAQAFWRVFVPLSVPGIAAGSLLVFILSVGFFIVPAMLGGLGDVWIAQLIETQVTALLDWPLAAALALVLLVIVLAMYVVYERVLGVDRLSVST